jgi:uncharacterized membrane protein
MPLRFPPIPAWDGLHPLVVHFPIALLMVTPVFLLLFAVWKGRAREMLLVAMILTLLGTVAAYVAVSTGEAAQRIAEPIEGSESVLHEHEELAELARNLFTGFAVLLLLSFAAFWKWESRVRCRWRYVLAGVLIALHGVCTLVLANAAHEGGRLVHEFGVRAYWPTTEQTTTEQDK